jgi:hypothetical protein
MLPELAGETGTLLSLRVTLTEKKPDICRGTAKVVVIGSDV